MEEAGGTSWVRQLSLVSDAFTIDLSKCPWVLEIHGPKIWGGHLHGEAICMYTETASNHGIVKHRGWALTWI